MANDKCILNLTQALSGEGLSDETVDELWGALAAEKERIQGVDEQQRLATIRSIIDETRMRRKQREVQRAKQIETISARVTKFEEHIDAGVHPYYALVEMFDGAPNAGFSGALQGYNLYRTQYEMRLSNRFRNLLAEYGGTNADGTPSNAYLDMFNKHLTSSQPEWDLHIAQELWSLQNEELGELKHRDYVEATPKPGYTNDPYALAVARAMHTMQKENRAFLKLYGADPGLIGGYILPQKWFPELMEPSTATKFFYALKGVKNEAGEVLRGKKAATYLRNRDLNKWVQEVLPKLDVQRTTENLRRYRYAHHATDLNRALRAIDSIEEKNPEVAAALRKIANAPIKSDKQFVDIFEAAFGKDFSELAGKNKKAIKTGLRALAGQGNDLAILLENNFEALKDDLVSITLPTDSDIDLPKVLRQIATSIVSPSITTNVFNTTGKSRAQQMLNSRILIFKDPESYVTIQKKYGYNNVARQINTTIQKYADDRANFKVFAGNIHGTTKGVINEVGQMIDRKLKAAIEAGDEALTNKMQKAMDSMPKLIRMGDTFSSYAAGLYNRRSNCLFNRIVKGWLTAGHAVLGQSLLPAISDTSFKLDRLSRTYQDVNMTPFTLVNHLVQTMGYMFHNTFVKNLYPDGIAREYAFSNMLQEGVNRFSPFGMDEVSNAQGDFFYNLRQVGRKFDDFYMWSTFTNQFDSTSKTLVAAFNTSYLGKYIKNGGTWGAEKFKFTRDTLKAAGIDEKQWNIIARRGVTANPHEKGDYFISPEALKNNITRKDIAEYLGVDELTDLKFQMTRDEIADNLDTFVIGVAVASVPTPNIESKARLAGDISLDSPWYGFRQLATEYLSYPARIAYGNLRDIKLDWTAGGPMGRRRAIARTAKLITASMVLGYLTIALKSIANRKPVPDPLNKETLMKSAAMGGALGMYGEFVMESLASTSLRDVSIYLGPTGGRMMSAADLSIKMAKGEKQGKEMAELIMRSIPNHLFAKWAVERFVAPEVYRIFGEEYQRDDIMNRWVEKYGTLDERINKILAK